MIEEDFRSDFQKDLGWKKTTFKFFITPPKGIKYTLKISDYDISIRQYTSQLIGLYICGLSDIDTDIIEEIIYFPTSNRNVIKNIMDIITEIVLKNSLDKFIKFAKKEKTIVDTCDIIIESFSWRGIIL